MLVRLLGSWSRGGIWQSNHGNIIQSGRHLYYPRLQLSSSLTTHFFVHFYTQTSFIICSSWNNGNGKLFISYRKKKWFKLFFWLSITYCRYLVFIVPPNTNTTRQAYIYSHRLYLQSPCCWWFLTFFFSFTYIFFNSTKHLGAVFLYESNSCVSKFDYPPKRSNLLIRVTSKLLHKLEPL